MLDWGCGSTLDDTAYGGGESKPPDRAPEIKRAEHRSAV